MRRSGHPSRPRAITCCFLASVKTLLISTKATCLTPKSTSRASFSLAGFQVTLIGRFWVTPEVRNSINQYLRTIEYNPWHYERWSARAPVSGSDFVLDLQEQGQVDDGTLRINDYGSDFLRSACHHCYSSLSKWSSGRVSGV